MILPIGEVVAKYGLSHRTLRFWEESGLIESRRTEAGYRLYDEDNLRRIRQAILLRKLEVPLSDIEEIFRSGSLQVAIRAVRRTLAKTKARGKELAVTERMLEYLLGLLESRGTLETMFDAFAASVPLPLSELAKELENTPRKGISDMPENESVLQQNDLRIVKLPPMVFAAASADGDGPEDASWAKVKALVDRFGLDRRPGYRSLGYGYYRPGDGIYVYVNWVGIPESLKLPEGYERVEFPGGLFAVLPCTLMNIGERWNELFHRVEDSADWEHDPDCGHDFCFEEVLNPDRFHAEGTPMADRQLDLFLAVRKVSAKKSAPVKGPEEVRTDPVLLCGAPLSWESKPLKPSRLSIPWYRFAQMLYSLGPKLETLVVDGGNTYAFVELLVPGRDYVRAKTAGCYAAVRFAEDPGRLPSPLSLRTEPARAALRFRAECGSAGEKIDLTALFAAATDFLSRDPRPVEEGGFLFREYRPRGKVEKAELFVFFR